MPITNFYTQQQTLKQLDQKFNSAQTNANTRYNKENNRLNGTRGIKFGKTILTMPSDYKSRVLDEDLCVNDAAKFERAFNMLLWHVGQIIFLIDSELNSLDENKSHAVQEFSKDIKALVSSLEPQWNKKRTLVKSNFKHLDTFLIDMQAIVNKYTPEIESTSSNLPAYKNIALLILGLPTIIAPILALWSMYQKHAHGQYGFFDQKSISQTKLETPFSSQSLNKNETEYDARGYSPLPLS